MNSYGQIGNKINGWYMRRLLEHATPVVVLERFAQIKRFPPNETKVVEFRRSVPFADATTPLTEGITPDGSQFSYEDVSVEMKQYGDWSGITDQINDFSKDQVLSDIAEMQGEQIASTREALTWDIVRAGTMKRYVGGTRVATDQNDKFTAATARQVVVSLQKQKARKITKMLGNGLSYESYPTESGYIAVTHTDMGPNIRDIHIGLSNSQSANQFVTPAGYGTGTPISEYELGRFEDIRYITSPDLDPFYGAGATGDDTVFRSGVTGSEKVDVYPTVIFGRKSFGVVALRGKRGVTPVLANPDVPREGDQLGQRGWAGFKFYFAALILNEAWIYRVESAAGKT